jgi:hypothetical protein
LAASAFSGARRMVGALSSRGEPITHWLADEAQLHGIRENGTLAVTEVQEYRHDTAHAHAQMYPTASMSWATCWPS